MKIKLLKISINEWKNESRDMRELSVYRDLGADISVLAKGKPEDRGRLEEVSTFCVHRYTTRPLSAIFPKPFQRLVAVFQWANYARKYKADIISGHDLIALFIGWMSTWFLPRSKKAKLIYDSHEFELFRNAKRNQFQAWIVKRVERFLIHKSEFSIVVNDFIADEIVRIHNLKKRPVVVRNIPKSWHYNPLLCVELRNRFIAQLQRQSRESDNNIINNIRSEDIFFIMYHGAFVKERGIETCIDLLAKNDAVCLVLMGDGTKEYMDELRERAQILGVSERLLYVNYVPQKEIWKYIGAVDVGLVLVSARYKSYYYSLPNKFFEYIYAMTPIICSGFPAMKEIVDKYEIGLVCDPTDLDAINDCVERFRTDRHFLSNCKKNMSIAKQDLNWENEKGVLARAYLDVISSFEC